MEWIREWFARRPPIEIQERAVKRVSQLSPHDETPAVEAPSSDLGRQRTIAWILLLLAVAALGVAGFGWWRAQNSGEPVPVVELGASTSESEGAEIVVSVAGQVTDPGLVRLPPGSRVADAIDAAGGLLPEAQVGALNLARPVTDGELVIVGVVDGAQSPDASHLDQSLLNLNTATVKHFQELPGIGPVLAQNIVDYRNSHGSFSSVDDLRNVSGIGEAKLSRIRELVTV